MYIQTSVSAANPVWTRVRSGLLIWCLLQAVSRLTEARKKVANKCDLCIGNPGGPACVRVCPTEALTLVTEEELGGAMELKRMEAARNTFRETCAPE